MADSLGAARTGPRAFWTVAAALVLMIAGAVLMLLRQPAAPAAKSAAAPPASGAAAVRQALFDEIQPVTVSNCMLQRFGEVNDGGYLLCGNLLGAVEAGYSYGISGYDGWGCDVSTRRHVIVHQYDCFNLTEPRCPGGSTTFHGECVGTTRSVQDGRPFDTLAGQFTKNGDAGKRLVVKMDVEGAEWDAFLLAPDSVFEGIDQLVVEFHKVDDKKFVVAMMRLKQFFDIAHVHFNNFSCDPGMTPFPSWAFEALLVNKRIAMSDGSPAPIRPTALDAPNTTAMPDCQLSGR